MRRATLTLLTLALGLTGSQGATGKESAPAPKLRVWQDAGPAGETVDVLFVPDGYQRKHLARKFWKDVGRYGKRLLQVKPFSDYKRRFRISGLFLESKDAGCDADSTRDSLDTALDCHFDTAGGRLLTFRNRKALVRAVARAPETDVVFVMVNTERFGGAGAVLPEVKVRGRPLPAPVFSAQDTRSFQIAVHELGHSMADLADEYVDVAAALTYLLPEGDKDLPYANVTRAAHIDRSSFEATKKTAKWRRFLEQRGARKHAWAHEGAYFRARGVFRPWPRCKMRSSNDEFCPVCCMEMARAICAVIGETFDEEAWRTANPLRGWR